MSTPTAPRSWTTAQVTSRDGTSISYRRYGTQGPCVLVVHGGGQAAQNLHRLAEALAGRFTVCVPDRRGRGRSGAAGDTDSLAAETDDLIALVQRTGAVHLVGVGSGGLIVLSAACGLPDLRGVAVFEPLLSIRHSTPGGRVSRCVKDLATGDLGAAVTAMRGTRTAGLVRRLLPRSVITPALTAATRSRRDSDPSPTTRRSPRRQVAWIGLWSLRRLASRHGRAGAVPVAGMPLRALVPTLRDDAQLVADSEETLSEHAGIALPVLLLGGNRSASYLTHTLDALQAVLPDVTRVTLPGVGHTAPDNTGQPQRVADELGRFFANSDRDEPGVVVIECWF